MPTPYDTLGVKPDATEAQIKSAYLKMAKKHHPDLNPGDKKAEDRFKSVSAAHDLLSDPDKRARFDRGEIDASGQAKGPDPRSYYKTYAGGQAGGRYRGAGADGPDNPAFQDIFADIFANARGMAGQTGGGQAGGGQAGGGQAGGGQAGGGRAGGGQAGGHQQAQRMRGQDQRYQLDVTFIEAALGASRRLTLPDGRTLDVTIPAGLEDGQILRLRGQGEGGWNGGPAGDALIETSVLPHSYFTRDGADIHLELPVTAGEAALGARVAVPTLAGSVQMTVPRHSDSGRQLRLRGRGIPTPKQAVEGAAAGDLYVTLKIVIGTPDAALEAALREFYERNPLDPRRAMGDPAW